MARMEEIVCVKCGNSRYVAVGAGGLLPSLCGECQAKEADEKRRMYLKGLEGLMIEERLRKIEELLYDAPWVGMI